MENASRALLIAAGILVGIMLLSLMVIGGNKISEYFTSKEENLASQQLIEFNAQYNTYDRDDVRGTDLISLINKILDFNISSQRNDEEKIQIDITIPAEDYEEKFCYQYSIHTNSSLKLWKRDKYDENTIKDVINQGMEIENKYSMGMATKLAANLSTLLGENSLKTKEELLKELKLSSVNNNEILKYYQYQQLKRAHFNSEPALTYTNSGRVKKFTFVFNGKFE